VSEWSRWKIPPTGRFNACTPRSLKDAGKLERLGWARLTAAFHFAQRKFSFDFSLVRVSFPA